MDYTGQHTKEQKRSNGISKPCHNHANYKSRGTINHKSMKYKLDIAQCTSTWILQKYNNVLGWPTQISGHHNILLSQCIHKTI